MTSVYELDELYEAVNLMRNLQRHYKERQNTATLENLQKAENKVDEMLSRIKEKMA